MNSDTGTNQERTDGTGEPSIGPPFLGVPPALEIYPSRGHRRLDARTYESKCAICIWGCRMPLRIGDRMIKDYGMTKNFNPIFTITNRITAGLTRIERARGFLEAATLSDSWVREMGRRALILEAHHTTHIEGTRLTLEQAERLLEGTPVPDAFLEDFQF